MNSFDNTWRLDIIHIILQHIFCKLTEIPARKGADPSSHSTKKGMAQNPNSGSKSIKKKDWYCLCRHYPQPLDNSTLDTVHDCFSDFSVFRVSDSSQYHNRWRGYGALCKRENVLSKMLSGVSRKYKWFDQYLFLTIQKA